MTATAPWASRLPVARTSGSRRILLAGVGVGAVAAMATYVVVAVVPGQARHDPAAPARVHSVAVAYLDAVALLNAEGGTVVVYGMRPGVADIAEGVYADDVLGRMAEGWRDEFRRLRAELRALGRPAELGDGPARLDTAYLLYVRTANALLAGARARGPARALWVDKASALGTEADTTFDQALEALDHHRARLGLTDQEVSR